MANKVKRYKDITGQVFGSLTALEYSHTSEKRPLAYWKFQCRCGNTHITRANTIAYQAKKFQDPQIPSCGCVLLSKVTKHGFRKASSTHPAYKVYRGIMDRCYNPNSSGYAWYMAKGVTICDAWKGNPESFVTWAIANGWKPGLHIDKDILCKELGISPHIYSPQTCRWVSAKENVGFATNRTNFGKHPNVRLSQEDVDALLDEFFKVSGVNRRALANKYGLKSTSSIYRLAELAERAA